ncbi:MAG: hypothetical protein P1U56_09770 [Saprospiraceae bacterium]|nr:hypothetical protein [Saprospiraceae bacterium]
MKTKSFLFILIFGIISFQSYGQLFKRFTFEFGFNKSKIFNTQEFASFEGFRNNTTYQVDITNEFFPITTNQSFSLGYRLAKDSHLRLRFSKNQLGSRLNGRLQIIRSRFGTQDISISEFHTKILSTSIGLIYEYHATNEEGGFVFGAGFEGQKNSIWTALVVPGLQKYSYSFHNHFGYLAAIKPKVFLHAKVFGTYYFPGLDQIYTTPVESAYVPLQLGIEVGIRLGFSYFSILEENEPVNY